MIEFIKGLPKDGFLVYLLVQGLAIFTIVILLGHLWIRRMRKTALYRKLSDLESTLLSYDQWVVELATIIAMIMSTTAMIIFSIARGD